MSQWFNWLFGSEKPAPSPVKSDGEIRLSGDKAIYLARKGYRETVIDLSQLQYVYVYTTDHCQNLVLNDYHQHFIPCSIAGFESFFQYLSSRFSFDKAKFFEVLASNKAQKVELWRAKIPNNCRILNSPGDLILKGTELCKGFRISSTPSQWISWDTTSQELAALPAVNQTINEYGLAEIRFHSPVQVGSLVLDDWRYYLPTHRLDVPLDSFYSNLRIEGNGDQNYFLVKKALGDMFGEATGIYEREDQNSCHWIVDGIKFSLIYWYDSRFSYQSGYAYFCVKNERIYPDYLTDPAYELNLEMTNFLFIGKSFSIGSDFRRSQYFRQTPLKVVEQLAVLSASFIIWLDKPNGRVGFANRESAMIFPLEILASLQCENVIPDRSSGGAYLSAILKQGDQQCILIGDCYSFDPYVSQLAEMIGLPVAESMTCE